MSAQPECNATQSSNAIPHNSTLPPRDSLLAEAMTTIRLGPSSNSGGTTTTPAAGDATVARHRTDTVTLVIPAKNEAANITWVLEQDPGLRR